MSIDLVRTYEPVLRFNKGEYFFPMRVDEYVPFCSLHAMEAGRGVMRIPPPHVDLPTLAFFPSAAHYLVYADRRVTNPEDEANLQEWIEREKTTRDEGEWRQFLRRITDELMKFGLDLQKLFVPLDLPREMFERAMKNYVGLDKHPPTYYYRVTEDSGYTVVQYWFFYAYNDFATSFHGVNDHEGDWESIYLFLRDGRPTWATYASHIGEGLQLGRPWEPNAMEFESGHPVVYVGGGSHASYHTRDAHLPDKEFVEGEVVIGGPDGVAWAEPLTLDQPWFTEYKGRWGSLQWDNPVHMLVDSGGGPPTGPKFLRNGRLRLQWEHPVRFAGLTE
jgi:hypothetical protein